MSGNKLDSRQSEHRSTLSELSGTAEKAPLSELLPAIDKAVSNPFQLTTNEPADLIVNLGPARVVNPITSKTKSATPVNGVVPDTISETITFPALGTGTVTSSATGSATLSMGANQFQNILVAVESNGNITLVAGTAGATAQDASIPSSSAPYVVGYITASTDGSNNVNPVTSADLTEFAASGAGGGSGDGGSIFPVISLETEDALNTFAARITEDGVVVSQTEVFIQSIIKSSSGVYDITFVPGFFEEAPAIVAEANRTDGNGSQMNIPSNLITVNGCQVRSLGTGGVSGFDTEFSMTVTRQGTDVRKRSVLERVGISENTFELAKTEVKLRTVVGRGSTNTRVRAFGEFDMNVDGAAFTVNSIADQAINGLALTVTRAGILTIGYSDVTNVSADIYLTKNATELSSPPSTFADKSVILASDLTSTANAQCFVGWSGRVEAGDVIRPMIEAATNVGTFPDTVSHFHAIHFETDITVGLEIAEGTKIISSEQIVTPIEDVTNEFSARIANDGTASITSQSVDFIESVNRTGTGVVDIVFKSGFFTVTPAIQAETEEDTIQRIAMVSNQSVNGCTVSYATSNAGSPEDDNFNLMVSRQDTDVKDIRKTVFAEVEGTESDFKLATSTIRLSGGGSVVTFSRNFETIEEEVGDALQINSIVDQDTEGVVLTVLKAGNLHIDVSIGGATGNTHVLCKNLPVSLHRTNPITWTEQQQKDYIVSSGSYPSSSGATQFSWTGEVEVGDEFRINCDNNGLLTGAVNDVSNKFNAFHYENNITLKVINEDHITLLQDAGTEDIENIYSARISGQDLTGNPDVAVVSESLPFIESVTRTGTGDYTVVFKSGFFNEAPAVIPQIVATDGTIYFGADANAYEVTKDGCKLTTRSVGSGSALNLDFNLIAHRQGTDVKEISTELFNRIAGTESDAVLPTTTVKLRDSKIAAVNNRTYLFDIVDRPVEGQGFIINDIAQQQDEGLALTVLKDGIITVTTSTATNSSSASAFLTLNATELSTSPVSFSDPSVILASQGEDNNGFANHVSWTGKVQVGDIIRVMTNGSSNTTNPQTKGHFSATHIDTTVGIKLAHVAGVEIIQEEPQKKPEVYSARVSSTGIVQSQNLPFVSSISKAGAGIYDITFVPGTFNSIPTVVGNLTTEGAQPTDGFKAENVSKDGFQAQTYNSGSVFSDGDFDIQVVPQGSDFGSDLFRTIRGVDQKVKIPTSEIFLNNDNSPSTGTGSENLTGWYQSIDRVLGDNLLVDNSNGTKVIVKKDGILSVSANWYTGATATYITRNEADTTASTPDDNVVLASSGSNTGVNYANPTWTGKVKAGDVFRIRFSGAPSTVDDGIQATFLHWEDEIDVKLSNVEPQFCDSDDFLFLRDENGFGSQSGNNIHRFSIIQQIIDNGAFTYEDDPVEGARITILKDGYYDISYTSRAGSNVSHAITRNQADLTRNPFELVDIDEAYDQVLAQAYITGADGNTVIPAIYSGPLKAGDIIRPCSTSLTNSASADRQTFKIGRRALPSITGIDVTQFADVNTLITQSARYNTFAGYGSVNNKIPYFTNRTASDGSGLVRVENSPSNGFSITALKPCIVNMSYTPECDSGTRYYGISLNSSELTTNISIINTNSRIALTRTSGDINRANSMSVEVKMEPGDVLRPHNDGQVPNTANLYDLNFTAIGTDIQRIAEADRAENVYSARIDGLAATADADRILIQSIDFIESVTRLAVGYYEIQFKDGFFSSKL
jgi:hypothetical protein